MTLKELQEQISRLIAPVNPAQAMGSAALSALLFDAMCDAAQKSKLYKLRTTATIDYTSANSFYMPSDMLQLLQVAVRPSAGLTPRPAKRTTAENADAWLYNSVGITGAQPGEYFYAIGSETTVGADFGKDKFALFPAPTVTVASGIVFRYLRYPTHPSTMTSTTELMEFPKSFHLALAYEAAWLQLSAQSVRHAKDFAGYHQRYIEQLATLQANFDEDSMFDNHGQTWGYSWGGVADDASVRLS